MPVLHNFVNPIADEPGFLGTKPSDWNDPHSVDIVDADVNPAAGIVESKLSLNFPTHAPVTLGVANGLSLFGQQLSMGLAGANSTGTLSAQDWNTFNSKQSALSFPLLTSLGGTSISNTGTFTNHSNTIIVGGGTIALGGFTLSVPATGTAALLATANVFTVTQTITPVSNSTSIFKLTQADTTEFITADSSNKYFRFGSGAHITMYRPDNTTRAINFFAGASNSFFSVEVGDFSFECLAGRNIFYASSLHRFDRPTTTNNAPLEVLRLNPSVSTSATGGAAGFGAGLSWYAETATDGTNQQQGLISTAWVDATNATRKAKMSLSAYDTAARLGIEIEADGSAVKLGLYGVTTVARATTGIGAATFVSNTSAILNDSATWDGYTIGQVVKALRDIGILT